ncbi:hypothetical protein [Terrabacter sp. MAHUQ-38]|uniref:hypothetical protein n=1 Tax=unclassified Terrabacter TaxID=2630222 RepID=UPI00165D7B75|nr:hypothetical protein [Terrabacter sp. MAHUQ-38]MBC9820962.1 hypothetical protein [Terrabacter sp. MAHUQ-38]
MSSSVAHREAEAVDADGPPADLISSIDALERAKAARAAADTGTLGASSAANGQGLCVRRNLVKE